MASATPIDAAQLPEFEAFYDEMFPKIYNYARHRTQSATAADEIVSEVFTRALEGWGRFDPTLGERGSWLFGIARNVVAGRFEGLRGKIWGGILDFMEFTDPAPPPHEAAEISEDTGRLMEALAGLDGRTRDIVCLRYYGQMTNRAIAGISGLTEGNVAIILFRGLARLRKSLPDRRNDV